MSFTHLQVLSGYSLFESTITIEKLIKRAKELEFNAISLTDQNVLYGVIPFYKACLKNGIKPIIGMQLSISEDNEVVPCILLAKTNIGYQHLIKLSSLLNHEKESVTYEILKHYHEDLICILPASTCPLNHFIKKSDIEAKAYIEKWLAIFQPDDFYIGVYDHATHGERRIESALKFFSETHHIQAVAINDVRYIHKEDNMVYDCLQAMKSETMWNEKVANPVMNYRHIKSEEEMEASFASFWPSLLTATEQIKDQCNVELSFNEQQIPVYPVPTGEDSFTYLKELCFSYAQDQYQTMTKEVTERITYELQIIDQMNFSDYFLIVWDFIQYAKRNHILVGPGRGSAAGSIIAYVLGITNVDPIKYELLFERFLNPERVSMPDIDIDFSDYRRDEVIQYVRDKYGEEHVAQIITFGTFGVRSLLRELFKTFRVDEQDRAFILGEISHRTDQTIDDAVRASAELKKYIKQSPSLQPLFKVGRKLEGLPRHISTHAAGVVISDDVLTNHTPLTIGANEMSLTQYPMNDLEAIGLLKIDFLGLRNLTFMENVLKSIYFQRKDSIDIEALTMQDEKTFHLLQSGKTNGIFQLESTGMKQVLKKLKPSIFEDIVAVNALYRPGPMDNISTYIRRKHGQEELFYPHQDLEPILVKTYGVLIYQEQIMQIAHKIAGFSLGEADILRRAVSKKRQDTMEHQRNAFMDGCIRNGYKKEVAAEIFMWIVKFSNYGFNRSHAVAYSKISYQLAYLKAHFPTHFYTELLNGSLNQREKIYTYIKEAKESNIPILPPSINNSLGKYTVDHNGIRVGLQAIKGIGFHVIKEIIDARGKRPFKNLFDFCMRTKTNIINRAVIEKLIMGGAFDETYDNRASLLASISQALNQGELFREFNDQPSLLEDHLELKATYKEMDDFSQMKKLQDEKELLGFYISSHPLKQYRKQLQFSGYHSLAHLKGAVGKRNQKSAVIIQTMKQIRTKRGDPMAFITLSDETSDMEAVMFPELYRNEKRWLKEEVMIFLRGKVTERNNQVQLVLDMIEPFQETKLSEKKEQLFIRVNETNRSDVMGLMKKIVQEYHGDAGIIIYDEVKNEAYRLTSEYNLATSASCLRKLKNVFGEKNVVLK